MTARFVTKGRADPWRTHIPRRPVVNVHPMDDDDFHPVTKLIVIAGAIAGLLIWIGAYA